MRPAAPETARYGFVEILIGEDSLGEGGRLRDSGVARALRLLSPETWSSLFTVLPDRLRPGQAGDKIHKLSQVLSASPDDVYRRLVSQWDPPDRLVPGAPATG